MEKWPVISGIKGVYDIDDLICNIDNLTSTPENLETIKNLLKKTLMENQFYQQLLIAHGINIESIKEALNSIEAFRDSLKPKLNSNDADVKDSALKDLTDYVSDSLVKIMENSKNTKESYDIEKELKSYLTVDLWNRLTNDSRNFLKTAMFIYSSLRSQGEVTEIDYSSVCMLISKALEVETTIKYHDKYIDYLTSKYRNNYLKWPRSLIIKSGDDVIKREQFTLGSVLNISGLKINNDSGSMEIRYHPDFENFSMFYNDVLLKSRKSSVELRVKIKKDCRAINYVNKTYRNPSAHKNTIKFEVANACIDYLLFKNKELVNIFNDMK